MTSTNHVLHLNDVKPGQARDGGIGESETGIHEFSHWISYRLKHTDREITRRFLSEYGHSESLPPVALTMLMLISAAPGMDQHTIALQLGMDKANAARLIRSLDKNGWLVRRRPRADHRRFGVYLTPAGVHELARLTRSTRRFEQTLAARFTEKELQTLISLLDRLCQ